MSTNIVWNGTTYPVPTQGDPAPWGTSLIAYLSALPAGALQKTGGSFTLTADVDFGASFGLKSLAYKSRAANPSTTGIVRLGNTESVGWRNAANNADLLLTVTAGNALQFNAANVLIAGALSIVNADISAAAAITRSKLATGTAYRILANDSSGVISENAAITASRAVASDANGQLVASATTATELGYVNGVTSAIQTQLDARVTLTTAQAITGAKTFDSSALILKEAGGGSDTATIAVASLAASRIYTVPDAGAAASFVMTEGTQTINGSKTISALIGTLAANLAAGTFKITGLGAGSANGDSVRFEQLKIFQYQIGTTTTEATTTSTSFADTNLSVSITPSSTSNRILIFVIQNMGGVLTSAANGVEVDLQVLRGAGVIHGPVSKCFFTNIVNNADINFEGSLVCIDSPATTSATTYKTQFARGNGSNAITHQVQHSGATSYILAIEIGAA